MSWCLWRKKALHKAKHRMHIQLPLHIARGMTQANSNSDLMQQYQQEDWVLSNSKVLASVALPVKNLSPDRIPSPDTKKQSKRE